MSEIINILALNADKYEADISELKQKLTDSGIEYSFIDFDNTEYFASSAASSNGAALACCSKEDFLAAKLALINSLSRRVGKSATIIAAMDCNTPDEQAEYNLHAALPEGGRAYPSADGLYSGFSCPTDNGSFFFMPFESSVASSILDGGLMEALKRLADPVAQKTAVEEFKECVEGIIGNGKTIAIAGAGSFKPLVAAISSVPGWDKVFRPDSTAAEKSSRETDEEYCARCARDSKEACNAELGICISDITDSDSGKYIAVSVADSKRAKGARVFAKNQNEDPKLLISASVIKLCEMLDELSLNGISEDEAPIKKKSRLPLFIILGALIAAMVICGFIAVKSFASRDRLSAGLVKAVVANTMHEEENFNIAGGVGLDDDEIAEEAYTAPETLTLAKPTKTTVKETTRLAEIITTVKQLVTTTALAANSTAVATTAAPAPTTEAATAAATTAAATTKAAVSTTAKPAEATTKAAESEKKNSSSTGSKWVFRAYGWGHGVGMSQEGAKAMAKNGSSYVQILENFYTGTTVKTDSATPTAVTYGGKSIPIVEYLCKTVYAEIGCPEAEALKAQIVCAYTFAKYYNFNVPQSKHAYKSGFDYKNKYTRVYTSVLEVLSMTSEADTPKAKYVDYNGKAAFTCYFDSSPGKTASADSVWGGGSKYPYLTGGNVSPEEPKITEVEITVDEMREYIQSYAKDNGKTINLDSDPEKWLTIVSHDSAVNSTTGYVDYIMVGDCKVRGNAFRSNVLDMKIRSHCFSMEFVR